MPDFGFKLGFWYVLDKNINEFIRQGIMPHFKVVAATWKLGGEKCESHWSGVENWLQQQDRCWAAVCPRFGLVPSVILGATTPAFSYIPILDLNSYLVFNDPVQHNDSLGKCMIVWLKSLPQGPAWFTSNTCPLWNFQAQKSQWKWLDMYKGKHLFRLITIFFAKFHLGMALFTKMYAALLVAFYTWSCHLRK